MFEQTRLKRLRQVATPAILVALALFVVGCGGSDDKTPAIDANGCETAEQPAAKTVDVQPPTKELDPNEKHVVEFVTNCGDFTIELDAKNNPRTAASFAHLAQEGLYDDTWFHRIVEGFVVQGGDPNADGTGGSGYNISEPPTGKYKIGTVAMAKGGGDPSGTSSSQFYIVIGADGTDLPPDYAIAGEVTAGMETVMKIAGYAPEPGVPDAGPTGVAVIESATYNSAP